MKAATTLFSIVGAVVGLAIASPAPAVTSAGPCMMIKYLPSYILGQNGTAVAGLQLGGATPGIATLSTSGFNGPWRYTGGGVGIWDGCNDYFWLNIESTTYPYKLLTWGKPQQTTTWNAANSQYLVAKSTPSYRETDIFSACKTRRPYQGLATGTWVVGLMTGTPPPGINDAFAWNTCVKTKLWITEIQQWP